MSSVRHTKIASLKRIMGNTFLLLLLSLFFITGSQADRSYGPVKKNDYLTKIVKKSYPNSSLTDNQIMVAILRANPSAFKGGNIHYLKLAATLKLPGEKDITSITNKEAAGIIAEHLVFAKQGKTGNFTNKPLTDSTDKNSQAEEIKVAESPHVNTSAAGESTNESSEKNIDSEELPSKIKIEIREQIHEKENKFKHVTALEKISSQQNKTLKSLDEQIDLLEQQLTIDQEADAENGNDRDSNPENSSSNKNNDTDQKQQVDAAVSSLEAQLTDKSNSNTESNNTKTPNIESEKVASDSNDDEQLFVEAVEEDKPSTIASSLPKEIEQQESGSLLNSLKSLSKNVLYGIFGLLGLVLFALGYFLSGRKSDKKPKVTTTSFTKTQFVETPGKPFTIPDQESLQSPILTRPDEIPAATSDGIDVNNDLLDASEEEPAQLEAELKINMARAYMDVGYIDAAKEVLEEVLKEGNIEQKETVEQMLSMI